MNWFYFWLCHGLITTCLIDSFSHMLVFNTSWDSFIVEHPFARLLPFFSLFYCQILFQSLLPYFKVWSKFQHEFIMQYNRNITLYIINPNHDSLNQLFIKLEKKTVAEKIEKMGKIKSIKTKKRSHSIRLKLEWKHLLRASLSGRDSSNLSQILF